jgi:regulator of cell morphogenesis and NO signaling
MITLQLAELAIHIPECIPLFEKYGFDFYQNGNQTLKEACDEKGLHFPDIDLELGSLQRHSHDRFNIEDMDIGLLINSINGQHHDNEAETLAAIHNAIQHLVANSPADLAHIQILCGIDKEFGELKEKLLSHCEKEDKLLFPQIRQLLALEKEKSPFLQQAISKTISLIRLLECEHTESVNALRNIKGTLNNFDIAPEVSQDYKSLMTQFKSFEADFHMHIHIENNVLFPKIKDMTDQFKHKRL